VKEVGVVDSTVFARTAGGGNPCPIVVDASVLTDEEMQGLAARFGHETAFVLPPTRRGCVVRLRFFVPRHEMEMCVHGTVAVVTWLWITGKVKVPRFRVETPQGPRSIRVREGGGGLEVWVTLDHPVVQPEHPPVAAVAAALRVPEAELVPELPVETVSVARPKTVVPLRRPEAVDGLRPDWEALWTLADRYGSTGFYPFAFVDGEPHPVVKARQFPTRAGYPEDPATGVAAGALAAYLVRHGGVVPPRHGTIRVTVWQGDAMGRPSVLQAAVQRNTSRELAVWVGGRADIGSWRKVAVPLPLGGA
jgi:PhzF family phenazine biosynthesis protein